MTYLAIPQDRGETLREALLEAAPLESGAFAQLRVVSRGGISRLVLGDVIPSDEPWIAQSDRRLTPSGRRISAAVSAATENRTGLAFVHSHPMSIHSPPALSGIDRDTSARLGIVFRELLDGPFASLVVSPAGWGGAVVDGSLQAFDRIACVGSGLQLFGTRGVIDEALDSRQIGALGRAAQQQLSSLRVAVIGVGGIGSPAAETLARMGVGEIRLIDHDLLDTPSNARRVFGVGRHDISSDKPRAKADAVAAGLARLELGSKLRSTVGDVRDPSVQKELLDVDVIISGTDTHSSRAAVSELALRAAIPLIDVGVRVGARRDGQLDALRIERRIQVPGGPCLWCWGTLNPDEVQRELLPDDSREKLEREGYITGQPGGPVPSVAALTVTAAGLATSALLGLVTGALDSSRLGVGFDSLSLEAIPFSRQEPDPACVCARWR